MYYSQLMLQMLFLFHGSDAAICLKLNLTVQAARGLPRLAIGKITYYPNATIYTCYIFDLKNLNTGYRSNIKLGTILINNKCNDNAITVTNRVPAFPFICVTYFFHYIFVTQQL